LTKLEDVGQVDAVVYAVAHKQFKQLSVADIAQLCSHGEGGVFIDVKNALQRTDVEAAGMSYWSL